MNLQASEFLYEAGHLPERTLAFKHALTHEVVYSSLLREGRRALHAQVLKTLEAHAPDRLDEQVEILAYHALRGEVWEKAFVYLHQSGDKARQAYANQEAIGFYTQALEVSERITPALDAMQLGQEGVVLSGAIHDGFTELRTLAFLCQACWSAGHYAQALSMLHEGMAKAKERQNTFIVGRLTNTLGWFSHEFGAVSRATELDHESLELGRASDISKVEISAVINLGFDYLVLGQYERALAPLKPTLERVQLTHARARLQASRVRLAISDAVALPWKRDAFDATVSGLLLNFLPDVGTAVQEMTRGTRPGGTVAASVWDYSGGMEMCATSGMPQSPCGRRRHR